MLYRIIKPVIRLALAIFCHRLYINTKQYHSSNGPLLLAVNHPNSFLDAIIIGVLFKRPVHFLARGDAFNNPLIKKVLHGLHCIPVYRLREGKHLLHLNQDSFDDCLAIFRAGGIVLIFSEGLCINEWNLRSLKKGTARLAYQAWQDPLIGHALTILPIGISYSSYTHSLVTVYLNYGSIIHAACISHTHNEGAALVAINQAIQEQLLQLSLTGVANDTATMQCCSTTIANAAQCSTHTYTYCQQAMAALPSMVAAGIPSPYWCSYTHKHAVSTVYKAIGLGIMALAALPILVPIFYLINWGIKYKLSTKEHYHSILVSLCTIVYTLLLPFILFLTYGVTNHWGIASIFVLLSYVGLWAYAKCTVYITQAYNYSKLSNEQKHLIKRYSLNP